MPEISQITKPNPGATQTRLQQVEAGAILYDGHNLSQPHSDWFSPHYWRAQNAVERVAGGRGTAMIVRSSHGPWVLRHYHRGGAVARILGDRYLFTGAERTRAFAEFRLMLQLHEEGFALPRPVAARYQRNAIWYRADLITQYLDNTQTLAELACGSNKEDLPWEAVGQCIARFHQRGVYHADLNAHNVLLQGDRVSLIDFDRAQIRQQGSWQQANLQRLKRSLIKESAIPGTIQDNPEPWQRLLGGYQGESG